MSDDKNGEILDFLTRNSGRRSSARPSHKIPALDWRPADANRVLPINFCGGPDEIVAQLKQCREQIGAGVVDLSFQSPGLGKSRPTISAAWRRRGICPATRSEAMSLIRLILHLGINVFRTFAPVKSRIGRSRTRAVTINLPTIAIEGDESEKAVVVPARHDALKFQHWTLSSWLISAACRRASFSAGVP
jgi:hypothetical protein